jgi:uncharacterized membrane protein YbhN (UPF0104 family)
MSDGKSTSEVVSAVSARSAVRPRRALVALRIGLGLAAGALLFWFVYWRTADVSAVWAVFRGRSTHYVLLLAVAAVDTLVLALRSLKWRLILLPIKRVPLRNTFSATAIGVMTTNLVPLRLDEVVRSFILGRREGLPAPVVFGTVAVERTADLFVLFAAVAVTTLSLSAPAELRAAVPYVGAALAGAGAVLAGIAVVGPRLAERLAAESGSGAVWAKHPKGLQANGSRPDFCISAWRTRWRRPAALLAAAVAGFARAVRAVPRDWRLPAVLGLGVTEMALSAAVAALTAAALGVALPIDALLVVVLAGYASFAIPGPPGSFGVYHSVNYLALTQMYYVPESEARAFVLLLHAMLIVPSSLIGLGCLWRERLGFRRLLTARKGDGILFPALKDADHRP